MLTNIIQLKKIIINNKSNISDDDYTNSMLYINHINKIVTGLNKIIKLIDYNKTENRSSIDITNEKILNRITVVNLLAICRNNNISVSKLNKQDIIRKIIENKSEESGDGIKVKENDNEISNVRDEYRLQSIRQLKATCRDMGLSGYSLLKKEGLITLIMDEDSKQKDYDGSSISSEDEEENDSDSDSDSDNNHDDEIA